MKKVFSIGLVLVMLLSLMTGVFVFNTGAAAWDGTSVSATLTGEGTASFPYLIGSGADLKYLAEEVLMGRTFAGTYFRQTANIDLGGNQWLPIGYKESSPFQGHYDGGDFTISNLHITTNHSAVGLFGYVGTTSGTLANECGIANLTVKGTVTLSGATSKIMVGGVVGQINYDSYVGTTQVYLKNVVSEVAVATTNMAAGTLIGGVCGHASGALFESVTNKGAVTVTADPCYNPTGGLVGRSENSTYRACINEGDVKFVTSSKSDQARVGGIVGFYYKKLADQWLTFENCVNTADVYAESTYSYESTTDHSNIILVGGIMGGVSYTAPVLDWDATGGEWRDYKVTFQSCANTGAITGKSPKSAGNISVGGILGSTYEGTKGAGNNGGGYKLYGCASSGDLTNTDSGRSGLVGCVYTDEKANYDLLIKDCVCSDVISGLKRVNSWTDVCVNSVGDSPSRAQTRAEAILSTATGDNDTVIIVVVALVSLVAICGVATKVVIAKKAR